MVKPTIDGQQDIDALKARVEAELTAIRSLGDEAKSKKLADVKEMIVYYTQATSAVEDRRANIHSVSLQLLGLSVAAVALVASVQDGLWSNWLARAFLVLALGIGAILFAAAILAALIYEAQSGFRYPFLKLQEYGNRWKWFYYGNPSILKISTCPMRSKKGRNSDLMHYVAGLGFFAERYRKEDLDGELRDAIIHLYLLQVHNYYKNRWYLQLTSVWKWTFRTVFAAAVVFVIYLACVAVGNCSRGDGQASRQATPPPAPTSPSDSQPSPSPQLPPATSAAQ